MSDPFGRDRDAIRTAIDRAEESLFQRILDVLARWSTRLRDAVFSGRRVDPAGVFTTERWFGAELDEVLVEVHEVFDGAHDDIVDDDPRGYRLAQEFVRQRRNQLRRIPDSVYAQVQRAVFAADYAGDDTDQLTERIDDILAASGSERWTNRARTIARTEATAAYNAGTFAGFLGYAAQTGGAWSKEWVDVHDDRVRSTHRAVNGQRVPLLLPFSVGGHPGMHPGDEQLPAREVVNCRCGIILVRPDERVSYANRNSRGV